MLSLLNCGQQFDSSSSIGKWFTLIPLCDKKWALGWIKFGYCSEIFGRRQVCIVQEIWGGEEGLAFFFCKLQKNVEKYMFIALISTSRNCCGLVFIIFSWKGNIQDNKSHNEFFFVDVKSRTICLLHFSIIISNSRNCCGFVFSWTTLQYK